MRVWLAFSGLILAICILMVWWKKNHDEASPPPGLAIAITATTDLRWRYDYDTLTPDHGDQKFSFIAAPKPRGDPPKGIKNNLRETDYPLVLPINYKIHLVVKAEGDSVIQSWSVPSLGIKITALPAQPQEAWLKTSSLGPHYGQSDEICGTGQVFMPIEILIVSQEDYQIWVDEVKTLSFATARDHLRAKLAARTQVP